MVKKPFFLLTCLILSCCVLSLPALADSAVSTDAQLAPTEGKLVLTDRQQQILDELDQEDDDYLDTYGELVADPIEGWNRAMFTFNDVLIDYAIRPLHDGYVFITPQFVRTGVANFFHNALFPVRFVNNLLQGRGYAAGVEMSRFVLNTTAGLGGFIDVAKHKKPIVPVEDEDLGQTFGVWGMGEGFYIVWPILGPSTVRDSIGLIGDHFLDPVSYVRPSITAISISAGRAFNDIDEALDLYDDLKKTAIEPYSSARDAYIQYRRAQIEK